MFLHAAGLQIQGPAAQILREESCSVPGGKEERDAGGCRFVGQFASAAGDVETPAPEEIGVVKSFFRNSNTTSP
jgi:hypothetical protein